MKIGFDEFSASARMSQYETGKHFPDPKTIKALADAVGVPMAYLFCDEDNLAEMILRFCDLPDEERRDVLDQFRRTT